MPRAPLPETAAAIEALIRRDRGDETVLVPMLLESTPRGYRLFRHALVPHPEKLTQVLPSIYRQLVGA